MLFYTIHKPQRYQRGICDDERLFALQLIQGIQGILAKNNLR